jgi:hypothetical protein
VKLAVSSFEGPLAPSTAGELLREEEGGPSAWWRVGSSGYVGLDALRKGEGASFCWAMIAGGGSKGASP